MEDTTIADGVELNAGSGGVTAATDDAGAAGHVQIIKLALSADGSATPILADANGLEVQGAGTAGTAAGGVVTIQGVASMTAVAISAASLPLPTGASTSAKQDTIIGHVDGIEGLLTTIDGDTGALAACASGSELQVDIVSSALPTGAATLAEQQTQTASLSVLDDWDNAASDGASVSGDVAHDSADAGEPVKIGGRADTTFQTAVADGDRVAGLFDVYGLLEVRTDHPNKWFHNTNGSSALTDTEIAAAPGAGLSNYLTDIIISSGAGTAMNAFIEEGSTKKLGNYYLEAIAGRSMHLRLATPYKATANTALTVTTSAAIAHTVTFSGFIAP